MLSQLTLQKYIDAGSNFYHNFESLKIYLQVTVETNSVNVEDKEHTLI